MGCDYTVLQYECHRMPSPRGIQTSRMAHSVTCLLLKYECRSPVQKWWRATEEDSAISSRYHTHVHTHVSVSMCAHTH